jgi:ADP-ribose pyrophosphatase YjhB (NUDIX family)
MQSVKKKLCRTDRLYLEGVMRRLQKKFPGRTPQEIVEGPLAYHVFGPLPRWTRRKTHKMVDRTTFDASAFLICTYIDKNTQKTMVVLQRQAAPRGVRYCATGGGYLNPDTTKKSTFHRGARKGEQPAQCAARETREEICDNRGRPILDLDPAAFSLIPGATGLEYRRPGDKRSHVSYVGHHAWLNAAQAVAIRRHERRMRFDLNYRDASFRRAAYETCGVAIMPLAEAAALPADAFAHHQECDALRTLQKILGQPARGAAKTEKRAVGGIALCAA